MIKTLNITIFFDTLSSLFLYIWYIIFTGDNWYIQHAYIQDDEAHQAPQALNEVNMDEDGADTVQHNIRHFMPFRITVDTSVYFINYASRH